MNDRSNRALTGVSFVIGIPLAIILMIWVGWITVTAFIGGQAPYFFLEFKGFNLARGLLWLFIIDPIVLTVAYWAFMLIMLPVVGTISGAAAIRKHDDRRQQ